MKKFNIKKFRSIVIRMAAMTCVAALAMGNSMAAFASQNGENPLPNGVQGTNTSTSLINLVFWIIRIFIIIAGGGPALMKIVNGVSDENPRDRNSGLVALVITGACFGATFLVRGLI